MKVSDITNNVISDEKLIKLLTTDYSEALNKFQKGFMIFKGFDSTTKSDTPLLLSPIKNRRSANTNNYYTLWLNNHPDWQAFPPRNVIVTSNYEYSKEFGAPFLIFPKNGTEIGICPEFDFWMSFRSTVEAGQLVEEISSLLKKSLGYMNDPKSYEEMLTRFKKFDSLEDKQEYLNDSYFPQKYINIILKDGLYGLFKLYFVPDDFELTSIEKFKIKGDHELWFDNKFIAVRHDIDTMAFLHDL